MIISLGLFFVRERTSILRLELEDGPNRAHFDSDCASSRRLITVICRRENVEKAVLYNQFNVQSITVSRCR